jgi:hypothetical protein
MEVIFKKTVNGVHLQPMRDSCMTEGKMVEYCKGEQMEHEDRQGRTKFLK